MEEQEELEKDFTELDSQVDALIEQGGMSIKAACKAMGIAHSAYYQRKHKGPQMLTIEYPKEEDAQEEAQPLVIPDSNGQVLIMMGKYSEIKELLALYNKGSK